uniref:Killer cell lectin like receptor G1 n=1 Tax=Oryctolagus cuniculus TaxID=9986 RepID=G1TEI4_RABIT
MEMADSVIYSILELSTGTQAQSGDRPQQKASSRPSLSSLVAIALGLLAAVLASVLLYQWISCQGSNPSTCVSCSGCPDLWMRYGNHCYYFSVEKKDWNSSLRFCLAEDSHLIMFADDQEMQLLNRFLNQDFHWIGLWKNDSWRWEDGSVLNFSRIISSSSVQKCGSVNMYGLQASSCEVLLQWICRKVRL